MTVRVQYVNPVGSGELDEYFSDELAGCAGPDVEVLITHLELSDIPDSPFLPQDPFYHGDLFRTLKRAQSDGFDAAVIGCSGDPGLVDARRMLQMPVCAPLEAALHLGSQLHQRMAILVADGFEAHVLYRDLARAYGLGHLVGEILTVPMDYPDPAALHRLMHEDPGKACRQVIGRHRSVLADVAPDLAAGAIERGCGVVYAGCTFWTGDMLDTLRERLGVPVIDPGRAAVVMAAAAARVRAGAGAPLVTA